MWLCVCCDACPPPPPPPATNPNPPKPKPKPIRPDQDNRTFVHINSWFTPSGVRATNLGLLSAGAGDDQLPQPLAAAGPSPPAPVVLSATNETLVPLLRRHAGVQTPVPLLVYVGGNITLTGGTKADEDSVSAGGGGGGGGGAAEPPPWMLAPRDNITVARPVVLVGRATDPTSIDFRMRVNQLVAAGPYANLTFDSLLLENLGENNGLQIDLAPYSSIMQPCRKPTLLIQPPTIPPAHPPHQALVTWCRLRPPAASTSRAPRPSGPGPSAAARSG
jgi:hypothetical protein